MEGVLNGDQEAGVAKGGEMKAVMNQQLARGIVRNSGAFDDDICHSSSVL